MHRSIKELASRVHREFFKVRKKITKAISVELLATDINKAFIDEKYK